METTREVLCACGCGSTVRPGRTFLRGHYARTITKKLPNPNPSGLCQCGCGEKTAIAPRNRPRSGWLKGYPERFVIGHQMRGRKGPDHPQWGGGRWKHKGGYFYVYVPEHPAANRDGYVYEHRLVMERLIGRYLEPHESVHHINHDKADNRPENLELLDKHEHAWRHPYRYIVRQQATLTPDELHAQRVAAAKKGAEVRWGKKR